MGNTVSWQAATSGFWSGTGTQWSPSVPGNQSVTLVNATGAAYTITVATSSSASGGRSVNQFLLSSADATVQMMSGWNLSAVTQGSLTGRIGISAGTLNVVAGSKLSTVSLDITGGAINESGGTISVASLASFTGGSSSFSGNGIFNAGTLQIGDGSTRGTFLTLNGATLDPTLTGAAIAINNGATLGVGSGTNDIKGVLTGTGMIAIGSGNTLTVDSSSVAPTLSFTLGGTGSVLDFGSAAALAGSSATVFGLIDGGSLTAPKNGIEVNGVTGFTATYSSGVITLHGGAVDGKTITLGTNLYDPLHTAAEVTTIGGNTEIFLYNSAVCFAEGTHILTAHGEIAVEALAQGDIIVTDDREALPVRWIGYRHIDLTTHPRAEFAAPVRIRHGAFAENQPQRDLVVSPDHCLFVDGKLIPAKLLINGMTIVQERDTKAVTYYHIELDRHAVLLAEGLPAESYLDTGNRAFFSNAGLALMLHPEFHVNAGLNCWEQDACAPLAVSEPAVQPLWQMLVSRAIELGFEQPEILTTDEADLRVVAGGRTFRPTSAHANRFIFVLPAGVTGAQLVSRAESPANVKPWLEDWRQLGVAVTRMVVRSGVDYIDLPVDHPDLRQGWHAVETEGRAMWRWTDGNALLPIAAGEGPVTVEVHVRQVGAYVVEKTETARRLAA